MIRQRAIRVLPATVLVLASALNAFAQITTGTVSGTIKDTTGAVVPGATVVLVSEAKGTRSVPAVTNGSGDYVFPNVTADTYRVEVTLEGFHAISRGGVIVSSGERVSVPALVLEPGGTQETVTVTAVSPLVQASSGERSYAVSTQQVENLPVARGNFANFIAFVPGTRGGANQNGARLGGASQDNIMMDGISAMDTGNNGQMITMNIESIAEVKVLTQSYQAEYGRSSGLQITAVTKSGTNMFHGSGYDVLTNSDWNANSWVNDKNGDPKPKQTTKTLGYAIGGPIGKPGGNNKLFFYYAHQYQPQTAPINNGNAIRLRVPTAAERAGDFSQTLNQNGALLNLIKDPLSTNPCTSTNTSGCFADGGVLGKIPANRLSSIGLAVLNRYPMPNVTQLAGTNYNYQIGTDQLPTTDQLIQQPAVKIDYQHSAKLRFTGKYSGDRRRQLTTPGGFGTNAIPGFTDVFTPYPYITNYAATVDYSINPTTFLEGTYGLIRNELTGGNEGGVLMNDSANRLASLPGFPLLYPNAGSVPSNAYAYQVMGAVNPPYWDAANSRLNLPPTFGWGSLIGAPPPNQRYPGWLNINRTQDVAISLTKVKNDHTLKAGFYNNHSFKAQNVGAGGIANLTFQGYVDFGNNTNNALDSGFGYSNAALGVFNQYLQASKFVEGQMVYNNTEFYVQDNWRLNSRTTLDYGVRFTRQQPQYDINQQMSNFFPDQWKAANAPVFYVAGCSNGAATCTGNVRNAMDPRTGQILTAPGAANTQAAIGTPIPGTGNPLNGIIQAGNGIASTGYTWPNLVVGPRFGMAYDLTDNQTVIFRGGAGYFYDRPDGNTVFSIPGNPPIATATDLRSGTLSTIGTGLSPVAVPAMVTFEYDAKIPASWQWNAGVQMAMPYAITLDVSYVGNRGVNRMGGFQGGNTINLNAVDFGTAYLPKYQDPTLAGTSTVPGQTAYPSNALKPFLGLANIAQNSPDFHDLYHSLQISLNRRYRNGFSFGANYTYGISFTGNTGITERLQHAPDGTISLRSDEAAYEELFNTLDRRPHFLKANAIWALPTMQGTDSTASKVIGQIVNDWRVAGVLTAASGTAYDLGFSYNTAGSNTNLTGSPDYAARIVYIGDPGSGCSDDQYAQFNTAAVRGPTYGSLGMESGRNILRNCADHTVDFSLMRDIRIVGAHRLEFRLDIFNLFNTAIINARNTTVTYDNPTSMTVQNSQTLADGSVNPARLTPRNAGFGAATGAQTMRNLQIQFRYQF